MQFLGCRLTDHADRRLHGQLVRYIRPGYEDARHVLYFNCNLSSVTRIQYVFQSLSADKRQQWMYLSHRWQHKQ